MPEPCHPAEFFIFYLFSFCRMVKKTNSGAVRAAGRGLGLWDVLWSCLLHRVLVPTSIPAPFGGHCAGYSPEALGCLKSPK